MGTRAFSLLVSLTLTVCDTVTMYLLALIKASAVAAANTYCATARYSGSVLQGNIWVTQWIPSQSANCVGVAFGLELIAWHSNDRV